jgi:hypothetical protein
MSLDTPVTTSLTPSEPTPTITLKRGKVEINIKNASAIVQRMEHLFPKNRDICGYPFLSNSKQIGLNHDKNREMVVAAKNWFKQEFYGTDNDDFEILVSENNPQSTPLEEKQAPPEENQSTPLEEKEEEKKPIVMPCSPPMPIIEKTVNKNAYEIRESILIHALDWVKFKKDVNKDLQNVTDDDVISTAQKFYKFVENRK